MSIINSPVVIRSPQALSSAEMNDAGQPSQALSEPAPAFRRLPSFGSGLEAYRFGVWETTIGQWRRDVPEAEFCHILSGVATFTSDNGTVSRFGEGDSVFFPAHSLGVWDVTVPLRKVFAVIPA